ncbi:hypothetical protein F2Q69_00007502 [Brassica cretica]|uniref:Uncharacterized protein n=2 Tax=Brassica cretica TaxID=69181 RepID=A0ABQ7BXT6_BRACR|nr:hypothetical protein F2Q69_00007502 [Brassica cretica]KAF3544690.1 hypothetical protein DY000_02008217 [Brassica cretica]
MVSEPGSNLVPASAYTSQVNPHHRSKPLKMSSRFSLFKKKVFEAMVVSPGRSSSLQSIKGVSQLCSKLKPFKKKALILFLNLETWSCEERWKLLCCGIKEEIMNTRRKC